MIEPHDRWMARAISLAKGGYPAPNPRVGCVIVKSGHIVGEGFHRFAGAPHAEAMALRNCTEDPKGATVYVTQEPCNHFGRTPPCARALIDSQVGKVLIAVRDPNPVASGGMEALQEAGIAVQLGPGCEGAERVNWIYLTAVRRRRPIVCVKAATTIDGFMADWDGQSKWITSEKSRRAGHKLRAELGSVLVGRQTVQSDDPQLTARIPGVINQPLRIVLDPHARLNGNEKLFSQKGETLWFVSETLRTDERQTGLGGGTSFDLSQLLQNLCDRGVIGVLIEGGPRTIGAFFDAGLVDQLELFVAPKFFGSGLPLRGPNQVRKSAILTKCRVLGQDVHRTYSIPIEPREK